MLNYSTTEADMATSLQHANKTESGQASLTLNDVARINENMKQIVQASNRLYVISLNAMFASRAISHGTNGFIEVTALLRDFSKRLESQVEIITSKINSLIVDSAQQVKTQKYNALLTQAVLLAEGMEMPARVSKHTKQVQKEAVLLLSEFNTQLSRFQKLIKIGENLAVLAKVEAVTTNDDENALLSITSDMTETIGHIGDCLLESQRVING